LKGADSGGDQESGMREAVAIPVDG